ncbi:MAG: hypothetical protein ACLR6I_12480 [Waltera sp.]
MLGGTITGNKAAANGGGVDMDCAFEMCGGSITSNEADANGGCCREEVIIASNGVVAVSPVTRRRTTVVNGDVAESVEAMEVNGDVNITGNTNGNVYLPGGKTITVGSTRGSGTEFDGWCKHWCDAGKAACGGRFYEVRRGSHGYYPDG